MVVVERGHVASERFEESLNLTLKIKEELIKEFDLEFPVSLSKKTWIIPQTNLMVKYKSHIYWCL